MVILYFAIMVFMVGVVVQSVALWAEVRRKQQARAKKADIIPTAHENWQRLAADIRRDMNQWEEDFYLSLAADGNRLHTVALPYQRPLKVFAGSYDRIEDIPLPRMAYFSPMTSYRDIERMRHGVQTKVAMGNRSVGKLGLADVRDVIKIGGCRDPLGHHPEKLPVVPFGWHWEWRSDMAVWMPVLNGKSSVTVHGQDNIERR